ncbi:MAG TPA: sigma-70 family RNA polymerase sigma factor [Vicinamibacterales bacterium]|nr:sigma-70 family RNA polymerase sigma factor [Vicinamibacterales bacterium]
MPEAIPAEIESLFRRDASRLISVLTRILGPQNLELAEDVMQDAFIAALRDWGRQGLPENPSAWLLTAARNRAIDAIRRERTRRTFAADLAMYLDSEWTLARTVDEAFGENWIKDDQLRMIFMCCHPSLPVESRVTLILKTLCGLSVPAIAHALLSTESTINKRLYRARQTLRDVRFELPPESGRHTALDTVHVALYLLFNEGYLSTGEKPILRELCRDAMLLARLLVEESSFANSQTVALLALMCFTAARLDARIDDQGRLVPLDCQDRSRWDRALIRQGYAYLAQSSRMEAVAATPFHLEAAIAARHCEAATFEQTDWNSICSLYDRLLEIDRSPMVEVNRAVAISFRDGPQAAIPIVEAVRAAGRLPHTHVVAAVLANLYTRAGSEEPARRFLAEALARARTPHERELLALQVERHAPNPSA